MPAPLLTTPRSQPSRSDGSWLPHHVRRGGFTLTELLVVMGILIILAAVGLPSIDAMLNSGRVQNATRTVGSAVAATRAFATRDRAFLTGDYSGAAVIVLPTGQLMYVQNVEWAEDGNDRLETMSPPLNGYARIPDTDMLELPGSTGVAGVVRTGSGADNVNLFAPPFAVRFDEGGTLISGRGEERAVFYDFAGDDFDTGSGGERPSNYDPATVAEIGDLFDQVETVIAVVVFDRSALDKAGHDLVGSNTSETINTDARDWIFQNGRILMFNRYTGSVVNP